MVYPVFTIEDERVLEGARVGKLALKGAGVEIPALLVGEEGRGRKLGVLPVAGLNPGDTLVAAEVGTTRSGRPRLIARAIPTTDEKALVVLRSPIGFRGSNKHTGDRAGWRCHRCDLEGEGELPTNCPTCGLLGDVRREFLPFPGEVLAEGRIAQGEAGRMGAGEQIIALVPAGVWFRVGFSGRRYGAPPARYYRFDGNRVVALTWEERELLDG